MAIIGKSMYPLQNSIRNITDMKARFDQLQLQLATGRKAADLAAMGNDRHLDLNLRGRLSRFESYATTIDTVGLRLELLGSTMARLDEIESEQRALAMPGGYGSSDVNLSTAPQLSRARLDEVLNLLNAEIGGRYLFAGGYSDRRPVAGLEAVLNGTEGRAGFVDVAQERRLADRGDGLGRLAFDPLAAATTVGLADAAHPFGFKLTKATTSAPAAIGVALTQPDPLVAARALAVNFAAVPEPGARVGLTLTLPDGSEETLTLVASAGTGGAEAFATTGVLGTAVATVPAAGTLILNGVGVTFDGTETVAGLAEKINAGDAGVTARVGVGAHAGRLILSSDADPPAAISIDATGVPGLNLTTGTHDPDLAATPEFAAASFGAALDASLRRHGETTLAAASTYAAAENFFNGQGETVQRVDGPDPATATALVTADPADTVLWYSGESAAGARQTVGARVDDNVRVDYGVQADETGMLELVRSLAAMTVTSYPNGDDTAHGRFDAMVARNMDRLSEGHNNQPGSLEVIAVELGLAQATIGRIAERHTAQKAQLETMLSELEGVSKEEVAMEILALQTRLEASYQTTSMLAQLSLVNYL